MRLVKMIFSRRWIGATIIVMIGMAVMVRLGIWQLDRLEERRAANVVLAAVLAAEPLTLTGEPLPEDLAGLADRKVAARGEFDLDRQVVLVVQNWNGRAGVHLITPFLIEGTDTAVLVDRGWIPQTAYETGQMAQYDEVGPIELDGTVALSQKLSRYGDPNSEPTGPQTELYRVDVTQLQAQMPYDLLPIYVRQAPIGNEAPPFRAEPEIDLSEGPHLSYAIQWGLFTMILGIGYLIVVYRSLGQKEESAAVDLPPTSDKP